MRKSEPNRHDQVKRLLIVDDCGGCLYGREALERIARTGKAERMYKVSGVSAEAFIVWLASEYGAIVPECRQALARMEQGRIDYDLLAAISEKVDLSFDDLEQIRELHFRGKARCYE